MHEHHNLIYGLKDGELVHISQVDKGLNCNCICPACGEPLVAKKGETRKHHFSHQNGSDCEYGYQTSLHLAAKEILSKAHEFTLPAVSLTMDYCKTLAVNGPKKVTIDHVELEKRFDSVIPDIVVYCNSSSGKQRFFFVEIYVTHKVDEAKLAKLQQNHISTVEIDLSKVDYDISEDILTPILLNDSPEKSWVYNHFAEWQKSRIIENCKTYPMVQHGLALHVMNCPMKKRHWHGKVYANVMDDCTGCEFYMQSIYHNPEGTDAEILCSGEERIATVADLDIPYSERVDKYPVYTRSFSEGGTCPYCGATLTIRKGKYGMFLGCSNFPRCTFTAQMDE